MPWRRRPCIGYTSVLRSLLQRCLTCNVGLHLYETEHVHGQLLKFHTYSPKPADAMHTLYMHPFTQARACCARHMHAPIYPSPCILCTPHACMHPSTQARACCARHMHAPIYPSPCMLRTPNACTHLPKPVHAVHATCMHPFTQARACCARNMHAPFTEAHAWGARLLHEPILLG